MIGNVLRGILIAGGERQSKSLKYDILHQKKREPRRRLRIPQFALNANRKLYNINLGLRPNQKRNLYNDSTLRMKNFSNFLGYRKVGDKHWRILKHFLGGAKRIIGMLQPQQFQLLTTNRKSPTTLGFIYSINGMPSRSLAIVIEVTNSLIEVHLF